MQTEPVNHATQITDRRDTNLHFRALRDSRDASRLRSSSAQRRPVHRIDAIRPFVDDDMSDIFQQPVSEHRPIARKEYLESAIRSPRVADVITDEQIREKKRGKVVVSLTFTFSFSFYRLWFYLERG